MSNSQLPLLLNGEWNESDDDCACPDGAVVLTCSDEKLELDNDCACPDQPFGLKNNSSAETLYIHSEAHLADLPRGFKLAYSPFAPAGPSVLNEPAVMRWHAFHTPQRLVHKIDADLAAQHLIQPALGQLHWRELPPETLTAWIHVTNACSLDCPYCYVKKSSARMDLETGKHALEMIFSTATKNHFRRVKLKYAGGEATLHFRLVRELHKHAQTLAQQHALNLREVVLSNGVHISANDADWLTLNEIKLMISLDGVGTLHDQMRPMKNGRGSFSSVEKTIDEILLPRGIKPDITITLTRVNAHGAADAVRWALERDLPVSLNFYRQNALSASHAELKLDEDTIISGMRAAYQVFEEMLPTRPFFNGLLDRVQMQAHSHTCGVGLAYLVVTHEGKLAQCQMHLGQPVAARVTDDALPIVAAGPIKNLSVEYKHGCRECEFRYLCTGGCPIETYRVTGRWDISSPNCKIYKTLLPEALRLEGLRLLKANGLLAGR